MKVAVIGSGGREHSICTSLKNSNKVKKIYCIPGNAGTSSIAENIAIEVQNFEKIKILIMGVDFGYEQKMEEMINEYDISEKLIIIKKPKREDVISAYNQCKFLVLPSKWELSPLTPLEGFACKKTVISTTAHGIPFTISHNENCLLVPPSNPQDLANAIL